MSDSDIKILVVEDDQFLRDFYKDLLAGEGFRVDTAADGEEGSAKIKEGGWNLVLLDIVMPKKDGLQILREIKAQPPKGNLGSVVILTNLGNDTIIKQAFDLGASGYLIKSALNPSEVLGEIRRYLTSQ